MKFRYVLAVNLLIVILGGILKFMAGHDFVVAISIFLFFPLSIVYCIASLIRKKDRVLAGFTGLFSFFLLGIGFKMMFFPGAGIITVVSPQLMLLYSVLSLAVRIKKEKSLVLPMVYISISLLSFSLMFRLMYWPGAGATFVFLLIPSITIPLVFGFKEKYYNPKLLFAWITFLIMTLVIQFAPGHMRYKFFSLDARENSFTYDRYSWFLYRAGKFEEAELNSQKAIDAYYKNPDDLDINMLDIKVIESHLELIKKREWEEYEWPDQMYR